MLCLVGSLHHDGVRDPGSHVGAGGRLEREHGGGGGQAACQVCRAIQIEYKN